MPVESKNKKLSLRVARQLPEFIRTDYPLFVEFLEEYYKFLEQNDDVVYETFRFLDNLDVDETELLEQFRRNIIPNIPKSIVADQRLFLRHAKQFYRVVGSEKSFRLLFRILYDADVTLYYPKNDLLIPSDGKWEVRKSIRTTSLNDGWSLVSRQITGETSGASATVEQVQRFIIGTLQVTEFFLSSVSGTFQANETITGTDSSGNSISEKIYPCIQSVTITDEGENYSVGDSVTFASGSPAGQGASGEVGRAGRGGEVKSVRMINFGVNYSNATVSFPDKGSPGATADGTVNTGALLTYYGRYTTADGFLSDVNVLQDSFRWQLFSYVVKTDRSISIWRDIVKSLVHPAGWALFGEVLSVDERTGSDGITSSHKQSDHVLRFLKYFITNDAWDGNEVKTDVTGVFPEDTSDGSVYKHGALSGASLIREDSLPAIHYPDPVNKHDPLHTTADSALPNLKGTIPWNTGSPATRYPDLKSFKDVNPFDANSPAEQPGRAFREIHIRPELPQRVATQHFHERSSSNTYVLDARVNANGNSPATTTTPESRLVIRQTAAVSRTPDSGLDGNIVAHRHTSHRQIDPSEITVADSGDWFYYNTTEPPQNVHISVDHRDYVSENTRTGPSYASLDVVKFYDDFTVQIQDMRDINGDSFIDNVLIRDIEDYPGTKLSYAMPPPVSELGDIAASTAYTTDDVVVSSKNYYFCTTTGTTGSSSPTLPSLSEYQHKTSISLEDTPRDVEYFPDNNTVYVSLAGSLPFLQLITGDDAIASPATSGLDKNDSPTDGYGVQYSPKTKQLYYVDGAGSEVIPINSDNEQQTRISVGSSPRYITYSDKTSNLYVTNYNDNTVSIIDPTDSVAGTVLVGTNPEWIEYSPATECVYVVNAGDNTITVIDSSDSVIATLGGSPAVVFGRPCFVPTRQEMWFPSSSGFVYVVDKTNVLVESFSAGPDSPVGVSSLSGCAFSWETGRVYITETGNNTIHVFDANTRGWVDSITMDIASPNEYNLGGPLYYFPHTSNLYSWDATNNNLDVFTLDEDNGGTTWRYGGNLI